MLILSIIISVFIACIFHIIIYRDDLWDKIFGSFVLLVIVSILAVVIDVAIYEIFNLKNYWTEEKVVEDFDKLYFKYDDKSYKLYTLKDSSETKLFGKYLVIKSDLNIVYKIENHNHTKWILSTKSDYYKIFTNKQISVK